MSQLDPKLPPRGTVSPFRAFPKVVAKLINRDTANGFAWAFSAKNYGVVMIVTLSALTGVMEILSSLGAPGQNFQLSGQLLLAGVLAAISEFALNAILALAVLCMLAWRRVEVTIPDAATIWAAAYSVQFAFSVIFYVGMAFASPLSVRTPVAGIAIIVVLSLLLLAGVIWSYVIAYQGQRWFSGSVQPFAGQWLLVLLAAWLAGGAVSTITKGIVKLPDLLSNLTQVIHSFPG